MHKPTALAVLAALAASLLAGCSDGGGQGPGGPPAFEEPVVVGAGKGIIRGLVLTPALVPVSGALVTLVASGDERTSDEDGAFVFADLEPGTHFLQASKPGWTTVQQSVDVVADVLEPDIVKVSIERIPGAQPRAVTLSAEGFLACSVGTPVNFMSCDATGADRPTLYFDIEGTPDWIQTEVLWQSTQPAGGWLYLVQGICSCEGSIPPVGGARFNETADATSPYTARADPEFLADHDVGEEDGKQLVVAVSASGPEPDTTNGSGIALNQQFSVYATFFYNIDPDPTWTFEANGPYPVPADG